MFWGFFGKLEGHSNATKKNQNKTWRAKQNSSSMPDSCCVPGFV